MYTCEYCNKEFDKIQSLSAHKGHCKLNPNNTEEKLKNRYIKTAEKTANTNILKNKEKKLQDELTKKDRIFICKNCGKEYILNLTDAQYNKGKFSKFCSRSCANSRKHSEDVKNKISNSIKQIFKNDPETFKGWYKKIGIYTTQCKYCKKEIKYIGAKNIKRYCSKECKHKYLSEHTGGYRIGSGYGKSGWYKGIKCDSTWELAFLIYHLDNNLYIKRCNIKRKYFYEGKEHTYYPDFITDKGIIEIKGYKTKQSEEKRKQNPDIINIFKEDIQFYLNYVKEKYNKSLIELYDNSNNIEKKFLNNKKYIWMYNDMLQKNTLIYPEKYEEYINKGWLYGRKKYKK